MDRFDVVQTWIDSVAFSHSKSEDTGLRYRYYLKLFCDFIDMTPDQIIEDYEETRDERFLRKKYARYLRNFVSYMSRKGYAVNTIRTYAMAIKSFFKYSDLLLGYVPIARNKIVFHNRDITKEEVQRILDVSRPRDKAFFTMMAQSGLRPDALCKLKLKHLEPDFSEGVIPCRIEVPEEIAKGEFGAYFTFMGEESIKYLKAYLATRSNIGPEEYVFTSQGVDKRANPKSVSKIFAKTIEKLKRKDLIEFEQKEEGKPRTVRLYNLRKFFRKNAAQAGIEYVNFWMGHKTNYKAPYIPASDVYYFSREDVEFHRKLYAEKAMPFLRLETATPTETDKLLAKLSKENEILKRQIAELNEEIAGSRLIREQMEKIAEGVKKWEKEKRQLETKVSGIESFQRMILDQPDDVILKYIKSVRRQLKKQSNQKAQKSKKG